MIAISFRFLAGRYHATPWGRHVNEGAVEWPPAPWRLLRALIAIWKRTLPDLPQEQVEPILRALAAPPDFVLPPASTGHTRHYMPWFKKGPDDRVLIFDTFVALSRKAALYAHWPDASLDDEQRVTLARILTNLNTLGRSESWCEATLLDGNETKARFDQSPGRQRRASVLLNGNDPPRDAEIIRLLCPDSDSAFSAEHVTDERQETVEVVVQGRTGPRTKKQKQRVAVAVYEPNWHLCMETLRLHQQRWSDPPGSRWVQYVRPRDCFKIEPVARPRTLPSAQPRIQVARYAFDSSVLPLVTETLPVAEAARRALMGIHGRLTERGGIRGRSPVFSGKDDQGRPLTGHVHAYYLPTDEDSDGRLDHLTVFARDGFDQAERRVLNLLRMLKTNRKGEEHHPLRLVLLGLGTHDEYHPGPLVDSKAWISATPYVATRYAKTRGRNRIDMGDSRARADFLMADLRTQLEAFCPYYDASEVVSAEITPAWDDHGVSRLPGHAGRRDLRPIQFKRFRQKAGDDGGRHLSGSFRIAFAEPVRGPLCFGHSSHFGLGLFVPERSTV